MKSKDSEPLQTLSERYTRVLKTTVQMPGVLESLNPLSELLLTSSDVLSKLENTRVQLKQMLYKPGKTKARSAETITKVLRDGASALKAISELDDRFLTTHTESLSALEVIVMLDGSRPSFLIKDGSIDFSSSVPGNWSDRLVASKDEIDKALSFVGRINRKGDHIGTGFLIAPDIILTNRHVLQTIATKNSNKSWSVHSEVEIDFDAEFGTKNPKTVRKLTDIVFTSTTYINPFQIDHSLLDLAMIRLMPSNLPTDEIKCLAIKTDNSTVPKLENIYVIGFPGDPQLDGLRLYGDLLMEIFSSGFGVKRFAPGCIVKSSGNSQISASHDASTLLGSSGSLVVSCDAELTAVGIHYGGSVSPPKQNWFHPLANSLDSVDGFTSRTLRDHLVELKIL
jgi:V8-like Glu-specific endopeptidase